jgi:hypothetical protein
MLDPHLSTLTGHQHDADRKQKKTFRAWREPHCPNGICLNHQHRISDSTEVGRQRQRTCSETISVTNNNRHLGGRDGKGLEHGRSEGIVRQSGQWDLLDANHYLISDANAMIKEPQTEVKRRVRRARRRTRRSTQQVAKASAAPQPACIKAYRDAGLGTSGLWSFSQRNRARALALIEPEPDINQIELFDPREGKLPVT